jgi:hypothetical protein
MVMLRYLISAFCALVCSGNFNARKRAESGDCWAAWNWLHLSCCLHRIVACLIEQNLTWKSDLRLGPCNPSRQMISTQITVMAFFERIAVARSPIRHVLESFEMCGLVCMWCHSRGESRLTDYESSTEHVLMTPRHACIRPRRVQRGASWPVNAHAR